MTTADPREAAVAALTEVIDAADRNWEALDATELANAILNLPGVEAGVEYGGPWGAAIGTKRVVIRLPRVPVGAPADCRTRRRCPIPDDPCGPGGARRYCWEEGR